MVLGGGGSDRETIHCNNFISKLGTFYRPKLIKTLKACVESSVFSTQYTLENLHDEEFIVHTFLQGLSRDDAYLLVLAASLSTSKGSFTDCNVSDYVTWLLMENAFIGDIVQKAADRLKSPIYNNIINLPQSISKICAEYLKKDGEKARIMAPPNEKNVSDFHIMGCPIYERILLLVNSFLEERVVKAMDYSLRYSKYSRKCLLGTVWSARNPCWSSQTLFLSLLWGLVHAEPSLSLPALQLFSEACLLDSIQYLDILSWILYEFDFPPEDIEKAFKFMTILKDSSLVLIEEDVFDVFAGLWNYYRIQQEPSINDNVNAEAFMLKPLYTYFVIGMVNRYQESGAADVSMKKTLKLFKNPNCDCITGSRLIGSTPTMKIGSITSNDIWWNSGISSDASKRDLLLGPEAFKISVDYCRPDADCILALDHNFGPTGPDESITWREFLLEPLLTPKMTPTIIEISDDDDDENESKEGMQSVVMGAESVGDEAALALGGLPTQHPSLSLTESWNSSSVSVKENAILSNTPVDKGVTETTDSIGTKSNSQTISKRKESQLLHSNETVKEISTSNRNSLRSRNLVDLPATHSIKSSGKKTISDKSDSKSNSQRRKAVPNSADEPVPNFPKTLGALASRGIRYSPRKISNHIPCDGDTRPEFKQSNSQRPQRVSVSVKRMVLAETSDEEEKCFSKDASDKKTSLRSNSLRKKTKRESSTTANGGHGQNKTRREQPKKLRGRKWNLGKQLEKEVCICNESQNKSNAQVESASRIKKKSLTKSSSEPLPKNCSSKRTDEDKCKDKGSHLPAKKRWGLLNKRRDTARLTRSVSAGTLA